MNRTASLSAPIADLLPSVEQWSWPGKGRYLLPVLLLLLVPLYLFSPGVALLLGLMAGLVTAGLYRVEHLSNPFPSAATPIRDGGTFGAVNADEHAPVAHAVVSDGGSFERARP